MKQYQHPNQKKTPFPNVSHKSGSISNSYYFAPGIDKVTQLGRGHRMNKIWGAQGSNSR